MGKYVWIGAVALVAGCSLVTPEDPLEGVDLENLTPVEEVAPEVLPEEPAAPVITATAAGEIGATVATLDATEPGFWMKTPLVSRAQDGRVLFGAKSVDLRLLPIDGPATGGSFISLDAMRAVGAPLTGFPQLRVFTR